MPKAPKECLESPELKLLALVERLLRLTGCSEQEAPAAASAARGPA
ncbi:MAG: hypothetical protein IT210_09845 [Armatimonadetes bacterium]|nr:hypothetical protein [Armatimonadota bacterium]